MDAVNPDYLAVRMLSENPWRLPAWMMPGNMLADRWPVLTSLYHGSLHAWTLVPLVALFGPSLELLRVSHALWGAGILLLLFICLRRGGAGTALATVLVGLLALDPAFIFAFRSQLYITLAPMVFVLLALLCAVRAQAAASLGARFGAALLAGLFCGLALYGYFIYAFFIPGVVAWLCWCQFASHRHPAVRTLLVLALGFGVGLALGAAGYLLGYGLIWNEEGGLEGLLAYLRGRTSELKAFEATPSMPEVLATFAAMVRAVLNGQWQARLMLGGDAPYAAQNLKLGLMVGVTGLGSVWLLWRRQATAWLGAAWLLMLSFAAGAMYFGDRLSGHHFSPVIVLAYLATGLVLSAVLRTFPAARRALLILALITAAVSVLGQAAIQQRLVATGGKALYSDAIDRFAQEAQHMRPNALHVFPDWGLFMPFQYLSAGKVDHVVVLDDRVLRAVCANREVVLALVGVDGQQRMSQLLAPLGLRAKAIETYADREGQRVVTAGVLAPDDEARCAAQRAAQQAAQQANEQARALGIHWEPAQAHSCRLRWRLESPLFPSANVQVRVRSPGESEFKLFLMSRADDSVVIPDWVAVGTQFQFSDSASTRVLATFTVLSDPRGGC